MTDASSMQSAPSVTGLLFSQVGYDLGEPIRVLVRAPDRRLLSDDATCRATPERGGTAVSKPLTHWGELWGSTWWVADLSGLPEGSYDVAAVDHGHAVLSGSGLDVGPERLWNQTWRHVALGQLERRARIAKVKPGWYDAGVLWQEADSHAACLAGLIDCRTLRSASMSADEQQRLATQIAGGTAYLVACQQRATELGRGEGPVQHDLLNLQHITLTSDAAKMAAAVARAANVLPADYDGVRERYRTAAARALLWARQSTPAGPYGFERVPNGAPEGFVPPAEHRTSDLLQMAWAAFALAQGKLAGMRQICTELIAEILARQVPESGAQGGIYGHFYTFKSADITEKAWTHNVTRGLFGSDHGQIFPQYVMVLVDMLKAWPDDPAAERWRAALHRYAYHFFLPACRLSPFLILPLGYYPGQGWLHFVGLWHGMNAVYGFAAALALEFEKLFNDRAFRAVAVGNLQWVAGLNAGLTRHGLEIAAHMFSMDIPADVALPTSMIQGLGRRYAGSWTTIRGSISNGFCVGDQFTINVEPTRAADGPHSYTDEDWITHSGGWLSGTSRLINA